LSLVVSSINTIAEAAIAVPSPTESKPSLLLALILTSAILAIEIDNVSIKAKSNEGLDSVGEGTAIAASAIVLMEETTSDK
jgi:2C-methyl-D-erythritol 2,4-cyclodiphosphate synthase